MKILILLKFPLFGGGSGTHTRKLAEFLAKNKKNQIAIACPDTRQVPGCKTYEIKPAFKAIFQSHPEYKRAPKYSELSSEKFTRQYLSFFKQIAEVVTDFKPDVIHVNHASFLTWVASYLKSVFRVGFLVAVHGTDIFNTTIDRRHFAPTKQSLNYADAIYAVSNHTRKWLLKVFGRRLGRKTRIITSGVDLRVYKTTSPIKIIDKKYKIEDKKIVLFVGRLSKEKGLEYLIRAAKKIKAEIFILGGGSYKLALMQYVKLVGAKNVHFLGYIDPSYIEELREFYRRASVVVLPSVVDESLGLVILEAMACGTPAVATKKGGIPMVIKDGYNGFLIRARSSKAIWEAINKILNDDALREKMAQNARKTVEERFDWNVIVPKVEEVYRKVFEITKRLREAKIPAHLEKINLEREKRELQRKIGYVS